MKNSSLRRQRWVRFFAPLLLVVGALSGPVSAQPDNHYFMHAAKAGDTLVHLAKRYLIKENDWLSLQKLNKIVDPHYIRPGTPIRVPLAEMKTESAQATVVAIEGPVESSGGKLVAGSKVSEGNAIKTGENGFATIKLADGSTIVVLAPPRWRPSPELTEGANLRAGEPLLRLE